VFRNREDRNANKFSGLHSGRGRPFVDVRAVARLNLYFSALGVYATGPFYLFGVHPLIDRAPAWRAGPTPFLNVPTIR